MNLIASLVFEVLHENNAELSVLITGNPYMPYVNQISQPIATIINEYIKTLDVEYETLLFNI